MKQKPEKCGYCTSTRIKMIKTEFGEWRWVCSSCGWYKKIEAGK